MSLLAGVTSSKEPVGIRAVISGVEKVGKTTLVCSAPRALLIPLEQGYSNMDVMKTPLVENYQQLLDMFDEIFPLIEAGDFPYETLVFDSATALERLIHEAVIAADTGHKKGNKTALTMESALGGYGSAYKYANELFSGFLQNCDYLATYKKINILLTCHVFAAKVLDPQFGEYDTWDLLLHSPKNQKTYGKRELLTQWADLVGFLHEPLIIKEKEDSILKKGISKNKGRMLAVTRTPGYVAGNRYRMVKDISIPREEGWNYIAQAIYDSSELDFFNKD